MSRATPDEPRLPHPTLYSVYHVQALQGSANVTCSRRCFASYMRRDDSDEEGAARSRSGAARRERAAQG